MSTDSLTPDTPQTMVAVGGSLAANAQTSPMDELRLPVRGVVGVDEAGRGPLAGSVYAAAVMLNPEDTIAGLADSKTLTAARRERLAIEIRRRALAWCVAVADVHEIDTLNILNATLLAMRRACLGLPTHLVQIRLAQIDGNRAPRDLPFPVQTVVKGDATVAAISAASILAKTLRDADCRRLHAAYPQYGFDQHKGYGTALHLERLRTHGPCPQHRMSFAPVRHSASEVNRFAAAQESICNPHAARMPGVNANAVRSADREMP